MTISIARRVRHFRHLRNLTQTELAKLSQINYRHLQKIESGRSQIKSVTIHKIAQALKIPSLLLTDHITHNCERTKEHRCCLEYGILELLPVAIAVIDTQGMILYSNRAHSLLTGYSSSDTDGRKYCWDFAPTKERQEMIKFMFLNNITKKVKPTPYYGQNLLPDGRILNIRVEWSYLEADSELSSVIAVATKAEFIQ